MSKASLDVLNRFSGRVQEYVKYRPSYPDAVLSLMKQELGLLPSHIIADLGSGTGIFTKILLDNGNTVFAVEPNQEMREAAQSQLNTDPHFKSVNGTAEATTLAEHSVDFVTSAQAFHWFDPMRTRKECLRILKEGGKALFVWNDRRPAGSPFLKAYEDMLDKYGVDYAEVKELMPLDSISTFFGGDHFQKFTTENFQDFDFEGLQGRVLSSSYAPKESHPNYLGMIKELRHIFDLFQHNGMVRFEYETRIYFGELIQSSAHLI